VSSVLHAGRGFDAAASGSVAGTLTHAKYRADIDGLRAIAVLSVIGFHAFPHRIVGGFIGVDIFFVISGYLISTILIGNLETGTFSYAEFYRRRIRRIFPALIVVLLSCLAVGWFGLLAGEYSQIGKHTLGGVGFVSNFVLWAEAGYFNTSADAKPLLHLWSLAIEEQFYIVWPVILGLVWRRKWKFLIVAAAIGVLSFAANVLSFPAHAEAAFYSPVSRFWELMVGGVLAYLVLHKPAWIAKYREAQSAAGLLLLGAGLVLITRERAFPGWWALMPTLGAALLISAGPQTWGNRALLSNKLAVWFGKISYPLYLWHWPLLSFALIQNNSLPTSPSLRMAMVVAAIVLAWLTYRFVEMPIRGQNKGATRNLVLGFVAAGLFGAAVVAQGGLPRRAVNQDETRLFIDRYVKLKQFGVSELFQERCDFYDWSTGANKGAIDAACTAVSGQRPVALLWGDSHMQGLSSGFRKRLHDEADLAQITTSGCKPKLQFDPANGENKAACRASNEFAMAFIRQHKPARVFVAQHDDHERTDWLEMAKFVRANQGELILLGPLPQWLPSLPIVVAKDLKAQRDFIGDGLDAKVFATNAALRNTYGDGRVRFVSFTDKLCRADACLAKVPSDDAFNLLVMDYGHLTAAGSAYVVDRVLPELSAPSRESPVPPPAPR
jgi:peptidoglycan/LPS O-acetylase OafA/YrhL